jgi:hypothetical protein
LPAKIGRHVTSRITQPYHDHSFSLERLGSIKIREELPLDIPLISLTMNDNALIVFNALELGHSWAMERSSCDQDPIKLLGPLNSVQISHGDSPSGIGTLRDGPNTEDGGIESEMLLEGEMLGVSINIVTSLLCCGIVRDLCVALIISMCDKSSQWRSSPSGNGKS